MELEYISYAAELVAVAWMAAHAPTSIRRLIAYVFFFATPLMTLAGLMGPLTGFDRSGTAAAYFGLTFLTPLLALLLVTDTDRMKSNPFSLLMSSMNPIYMVCGPIPKSGRLRLRIRWSALWRRLRVVQGDMIIGVFFIALTRHLSSFLILRDSVGPFDVLLFGAIFEGYVYFNFAGYSMLAWGLLRLLGSDVPRNFAMPFCSASVVEYWRRWHISLSNVLRELFFAPGRQYLGIYGAAALTFIASAFWHGVTLNFVLWGFFHTACWGISRWLFTRGAAKWLQVMLLIPAVILGRVIFAESDTDVLAMKFASLFDPVAWREQCDAMAVLGSSNKKDLSVLVLAVCLILTEARFARRTCHQHYQHLKTPLVSTLLLASSVFLGNFTEVNAVYGQR